MGTWATRIALLACCGGTSLVLLLFAPALDAPFLVPKFAALEIAASLGVLAMAFNLARTGRAAWTRWLSAGALLVLVTTAVSWLAARQQPEGAPYALAALMRWASLFGVAAGASVLDESANGRRRVLEVVTVTAFAISIVGLWQHLGLGGLTIPVYSTPGSTFGNRNLAAEAIALALPLGVIAWLRAEGAGPRWIILVAVGTELVFLAATRARGAWLGAGAGLVTLVILLGVRWSRSSVLVVVALGVLTALAAAVPGRWSPHDAGDAKRFSGVIAMLEGGLDARLPALRTRFGLWRRTCAMISDHPWLGVGPGNWPVFYPRYAEPGAARDGVLSAAMAPRQAHDDLLERTAETGAIGLLGATVLAAAVVLAVRERMRTGDLRTRQLTAGAAATLVALVVTSLAGFPLEMPGTLALSGVALGFVAPARSVPPPRRGRLKVPAVATAVALVALFAFACVRAARSVRGSYWLGVAHAALRRDRVASGGAVALNALDHSLDASPNEFVAELRKAQVLLKAKRASESIAASTRALAIEPYSPNATAMLAAGYAASAQPQAARDAATRALALLEQYPFALAVRARAEAELGDTSSANADREALRNLALHAEEPETARAAREALTQIDP